MKIVKIVRVRLVRLIVLSLTKFDNRICPDKFDKFRLKKWFDWFDQSGLVQGDSQGSNAQNLSQIRQFFEILVQLKLRITLDIETKEKYLNLGQFGL